MGEGEHSLIWPRWVCAAEQGVVSRILTLEPGFHHLASCFCRVSFWTRRIWRLVIYKQSTCACIVPTTFCAQNKWIQVSSVKQGHGLKTLAAHLY